MTKKIAISQSNYIPWKGYFDLIDSVDEFVFYDCAQYTRRDWRNRNWIKSPAGMIWLSIPVRTKGAYLEPISAIEVADVNWSTVHWMQIERCYARASSFRLVADFLSGLYRSMDTTMLSKINSTLVMGISGYLGVQTKFRDASEFLLQEGRSERLLGICQSVGATTYVSGPAARAYLDIELFSRHGIEVEWFDYSGYPEYPQLWGDFVHEVSIVDLLMNCGPEASQYFRRVKS
jgi:WbqC-like protein family